MKSAGHETYSIEPETMWAATRQRPNEPGSVYLRWEEDNQIHREAIYKGPTTLSNNSELVFFLHFVVKKSENTLTTLHFYEMPKKLF